MIETEFERVIDAFVCYLRENNLDDLPSDPVRDKNSCWSKISLKCFGDNTLKHCQYLKVTWERGSRNIKSLVFEKKSNFFCKIRMQSTCDN